MPLIATSVWSNYHTQKGQCTVTTMIYSAQQNTIDISGARGFVFVKNKIVLVHAKTKNNWQIPGGGREGSENPEEIFRRELHEETGITDLIFCTPLCYRTHRQAWISGAVTVDQDCIFIAEAKSLPKFSNDPAGGVDCSILVTLDNLNNYLQWDENSLSNLLDLVVEFKKK